MDNPNPLLNAVVVQNLFQYLRNSEDWKNLRLVCHLWNDLLWLEWRTMIATARLGPGTPTRSLSHLERPSKWNTDWAIDDFLRIFLDPSDPCQLVELPFKRFILSGIKLEATPLLKPVDGHASPNFWNTIGPLVTHLTFEACEFQGDSPDIFVDILVKKLPALQSLTLINCTTVPRKVINSNLVNDTELVRNLNRNRTLRSIKIVGSPPICFARLIMIAPYIESLTLDDSLISQSEYGFYPIVYNTLSKVKLILGRSTVGLNSLDVMDVFFFNTLFQRQSRFWRRLSFPLEHLSLTITNDVLAGIVDDVGDYLLPAIRQHYASLKTLKIFRPPVDQVPLQSSFQHRMLGMRELSLSGNIMGTLEFLRKMPNMKVLRIDFRSYDNLERMRKLFYPSNQERMIKKFAERYQPFDDRDVFNVGRQQRIRLRLMCHFHLNLEMVPHSVRMTADWMPNLKSLETVLFKDGFRAVCRGLPNLEDLVLLYDSRVDDETITGIGKSTRNPANITALRRLKKFHRKMLCDAKEYRLGSQSVTEGFLKMTNLLSVHICVDENMAAEAEEALKDHVEDVKMTRIHETPPVNEEWECCKLKAFLNMINI